MTQRAVDMVLVDFDDTIVETAPRFQNARRRLFEMMATHGFDAEAWCPDCQFYKVRRIPKKRPVEDYGY